MTSSVAYNLQFCHLSPGKKPSSSSQPLPLTLFCDFDGPIVDVSERYYSTYKLGLTHTQKFYQAQGKAITLKILSQEEFWQMKQERVYDTEIAKRSGLQGEQISFFLQYVREIVNQPELLEKDKIQPGVTWALALLHSQGVKLVLVTLRCESQVREILNHYNLEHLFSDIYGSQDCHVAYQNNAEVKTQFLRQAVADYGKKSAYMVGDTEADILAAKTLKIPAIALTCGTRSSIYLQQFQPNYLYTDLLSTAHNLLGKLSRY